MFKCHQFLQILFCCYEIHYCIFVYLVASFRGCHCDSSVPVAPMLSFHLFPIRPLEHINTFSSLSLIILKCCMSFSWSAISFIVFFKHSFFFHLLFIFMSFLEILQRFSRLFDFSTKNKQTNKHTFQKELNRVHKTMRWMFSKTKKFNYIFLLRCVCSGSCKSIYCMSTSVPSLLQVKEISLNPLYSHFREFTRRRGFRVELGTSRIRKITGLVQLKYQHDLGQTLKKKTLFISNCTGFH